MEFVIFVFTVLVGWVVVIKYQNTVLDKKIQTMREGQVWRQQLVRNPENPWNNPEYIDYLIMEIRINQEGDTWIQYKIHDMTPAGIELLGIREFYQNYIYEIAARKFVRRFNPVLIKDIE